MDIKENNRIFWLDLTRCIAILLVVLCHSVEAVYNMNYETWQQLSLFSKLFRNISFTLGRLGVPLFLFLTGYLLLYKKTDSTINYKEFYKKHLIPLIIIYIIWSIIYYIFLCLYSHKLFPITDLLLYICFLKKIPLPHIWYVPMIIGMYLFMPLLAHILKTANNKLIRILIASSFVFHFLLPLVNLNSIIEFPFSGGIYALYILAGYYIGKGALKSINNLNIILFMLANLILSIAYQNILSLHYVNTNLWYDFFCLFISSSCLFELLSRTTIKIKPIINNSISYISKISFGIYFVHIIIQEVLIKAIHIPLLIPLSVLILWVLVLIISIAIIMILSNFKLIKKYVFFIRA